MRSHTGRTKPRIEKTRQTSLDRKSLARCWTGRNSSMRTNTIACCLVTCLFGAVGATMQVSRNLATANALDARNQALTLVAKYEMSRNCWEWGKKPYLIGDRPKLPGNGTSPTACFTNGTQYGYASHGSGQFALTQVFSSFEVKTKKDELRQNHD